MRTLLVLASLLVCMLASALATDASINAIFQNATQHATFTYTGVYGNNDTEFTGNLIRISLVQVELPLVNGL